MMLNHKVAVITGASRGLGAAFARRFAQEGAAVSLGARNLEQLSQVATSIEAEGGVALATRCDITRPEEVEAFARATFDRFGRVDILVNNAGVSGHALFLETSDELWERMIAVNLSGPRRVTKAFLPAMVAQGSGKVIFIASNAAKQGFAADGAYSAAKAGLLALTKVLAVEVGKPGIDVFAVCPGLVLETEMGAAVLEDLPRAFGMTREGFLAWANSANPKGYLVTLPEIVDLVTFLASPGSTALHGGCLTADHGFTHY